MELEDYNSNLLSDDIYIVEGDYDSGVILLTGANKEGSHITLRRID